MTTNALVVAKVQSAIQPIGQFPIFSDAINLSPGVYQIPYYSIADDTAVDGVIETAALSAVTLTFGTPITHAVGGRNLLLSGGILEMFDGLVAVEKGFYLYPEAPNVLLNATSGGFFGPGLNTSAQF